MGVASPRSGDRARGVVWSSEDADRVSTPRIKTLSLSCVSTLGLGADSSPQGVHSPTHAARRTQKSKHETRILFTIQDAPPWCGTLVALSPPRSRPVRCSSYEIVLRLTIAERIELSSGL
eukprot:4758946-Pyramimonas_sp.AAC.1